MEAGGSTITDLSRADSNSYLTDPSLLDRLVTEKQERGAAAVRQEGWKWVLIMPDFDALDGYGEMRGKAQPMPPIQAKALANTLREADRFRDRDELDDDEPARLDALDHEIAALSERMFELAHNVNERFSGLREAKSRNGPPASRLAAHDADLKTRGSSGFYIVAHAPLWRDFADRRNVMPTLGV